MVGSPALISLSILTEASSWMDAYDPCPFPNVSAPKVSIRPSGSLLASGCLLLSPAQLPPEESREIPGNRIAPPNAKHPGCCGAAGVLGMNSHLQPRAEHRL